MNILNPTVAIIGAGNIATTVHIPVLKRLGVRIHQVIDPNPYALERARRLVPDVLTATKIEELANDVQFAIVCSPNLLHPAQVRFLLNRNVHVLCEKPLAPNGEEARELLALAKEKKCTLQTGYYRRYHSAAQELHRLINSKTYGALQKIELVAGGVMNGLPAGVMRKELSGGGCTIDLGTHMLDALLLWLDDYTIDEYADDQRGGIEANAVVQATSVNGIPISVLLSRTNNLGFQAMFQFERTRIRYELNSGHILTFISDQEHPLENGQPYSAIQQLDSPRDSFYYFELQWKEFINRASGRENSLSIANDAHSIRVSELVAECYQRRQPLTFAWESIFKGSQS